MSVLEQICECLGISILLQLKHAPVKIMSIFIVVLSAIGCGYEIYKVFVEYDANPTSTQYRLISDKKHFVYPKVAVCSPSRMINESRAKELGERLQIDDILGGLLTIRSNPLYNILTNLYNNSTIRLALPKHLNVSDIFKSISFEAQEIFRGCIYGGVKCSSEEITIEKVINEFFGVCFVLDVSRSKKQFDNLLLIVDTKHDATHLAFTDGLFVQISEHFEPFSARRIRVPPGFTTELMIQPTVTAMDQQYGECTTDMPRSVLGGKYSLELCAEECRYRKTYYECGCVSLYNDDSLLLLYNSTRCSTEVETSCEANINENVERFEDLNTCKANYCKIPCRTVEYSPTATFSNFVPESLPLYFSQSSNSNLAGDAERWRRNFVVLSIACQSRHIIEIRQVPSSSWDDFLSQVGGHLGLFLGASLLSIFQIILVLVEQMYVHTIVH